MSDEIWFYVFAVAAIITVLYFLRDVFLWLFGKIFHFFSPYRKYSSVHDFYQRSGSLFDKRKLADLKVVVVDDQPENYPVDELESAEFSVEWVSQVSLTDYYVLYKYDVIFMDITGVVKEDLKTGGFELIKRIKSENRSPFIVGVSSKRFDPTLTEFWSLTDAQVKTPINFIAFEEQVRKAWQQRYSGASISLNIDHAISFARISMKERGSVNRSVMRYLDGRFDDSVLLRKLNSSSHGVDSHGIVDLCKKMRSALVKCS